MKHNKHDEIENFEEDKSQFMTFRIQNYEYGVGIGSIKEIKGWMSLTALPNTPPYVLGVINLRGTVVPIFDLRARFGLGLSEPTKSHVVLILNVGDRLMGLLVDAVTEIITVSSTEIRPVPAVQANDSNDHGSIFKGIVSLDDRMVVLLVVDQIFDHSVTFCQETLKKTLHSANTASNGDKEISDKDDNGHHEDKEHNGDNEHFAHKEHNEHSEQSGH